MASRRLKVKKDKEKLEKEQERIAKREEELRLKKEKELVFAEERERKARMKTEETNKGQGSTVNPSGRYSGGTISKFEAQTSAARAYAIFLPSSLRYISRSGRPRPPCVK